MPDDGVISRNVLADQVKDRLLQDILSGRYPPDSRIIETRVAREMGTSQAPVREALRGLEALGVVEILPFRGARVRRPTTSDLLEAYAVRFALESLAARLAVERITDEALVDLEALSVEMQRAAAAGDRHAVAEADARFHAWIIGAAGNRTLERVWRSLEPYSRTYITLIAPGSDPAWTASIHKPILDALRTRDAELVVGTLHHHFEDIAARLGSAWASSLDEPAAPSNGAAPTAPVTPGAS